MNYLGYLQQLYYTEVKGNLSQITKNFQQQGKKH